MAGLAAVAPPHLCGGIRCRSAHHADDTGHTESFRFLPAQGAYTLRDRAAQWWFALAARFYPAGQPKGMGLELKESVSISAFRSLHLSSCGGDHSCFVSNVFRVCRV